MRSFYLLIVSIIAALLMTACDISFSASPGGIEDQHKPKVIENLAPVPEGFLDFSVETTTLFFKQGRDGIQDRLHPAMQDITGLKWSALEKFASDKADLNAIEYYGHGFGEDNGIPLVVVQLKVPFDGGYNIVKAIMPTNETCCRLAGLEVNAQKVKSFKLGK